MLYKSETAVIGDLLTQQFDMSKHPLQIEAVLIIDDNITLRDFLANVFSTVFLVDTIYTATNGAEGLKIFQQQKHHIVLIILDIEMPIMNGPQTYKKLRQIAPHVRVIVSSALNYVDAKVQFDEQTLPVYLQKPYTLETLLKIVYSEFATIRDMLTKSQLSQALMTWDDDGGQQGNIFAG